MPDTHHDAIDAAFAGAMPFILLEYRFIRLAARQFFAC